MPLVVLIFSKNAIENKNSCARHENPLFELLDRIYIFQRQKYVIVIALDCLPEHEGKTRIMRHHTLQILNSEELQ